MINNRLKWACPYYRWNDATVVSCEGCRLTVANKSIQKWYFKKYCTNRTGWHLCSIAQVHSLEYAEKEKDEDEDC